MLTNVQYHQNGKAYELQTWYTHGARRPYHRQVPWHSRSKIKVARSRVPSDSCWTISRERKVSEKKTKLVERLPTSRTIKRTYFKFKKSKVKITRPINAEIKSVSYLTKEKACELQSWYIDGARRPVSSTSAMTSNVKGQAHVMCIMGVGHKLRTKSPINSKMVGRLPTLRTITRTRFKVKRSKVKVTRLINAETESVSSTNFKLGRRLEHALSTAMAS